MVPLSVDFYPPRRGSCRFAPLHCLGMDVRRTVASPSRWRTPPGLCNVTDISEKFLVEPRCHCGDVVYPPQEWCEPPQVSLWVLFTLFLEGDLTFLFKFPLFGQSLKFIVSTNVLLVDVDKWHICMLSHGLEHVENCSTVRLLVQLNDFGGNVLAL